MLINSLFPNIGQQTEINLRPSRTEKTRLYAIKIHSQALFQGEPTEHIARLRTASVTTANPLLTSPRSYGLNSGIKSLQISLECYLIDNFDNFGCFIKAL